MTSFSLQPKETLLFAATTLFSHTDKQPACRSHALSQTSVVCGVRKTMSKAGRRRKRKAGQEKDGETVCAGLIRPQEQRRKEWRDA